MNALLRFEARQAYDTDVGVPCAWMVWDREFSGPLTWEDLARVGLAVPAWSVPLAPALLESQQAAYQAALVFAASLARW